MKSAAVAQIVAQSRASLSGAAAPRACHPCRGSGQSAVEALVEALVDALLHLDARPRVSAREWRESQACSEPDNHALAPWAGQTRPGTQRAG